MFSGNKAEADYKKGLQKLKIRKFKTAINFFNNALTELHNVDPLAYVKMSNIYTDKTEALIELGRNKEAMDSIYLALKYQPNYGRAGEIKNKLEDSMKNKLQTDFTRILDSAAKYSKNGEYRMAIDHWKKLIELRPNYITAWIMMGQDYEKLNELRDALKCYDKALEFDPQNADAQWYKKNLDISE